MISFIIPGKPIAQQRPRKGKGKKFYNAQSKIKIDWQWQARVEYCGPILDGAVDLALEFVLEPPKSWPQYRKTYVVDNNRPVMTKPDLDNYVKWVLDCLQGVVYKDDAQVARIIATKRYSEKALTRIEISENL